MRRTVKYSVMNVCECADAGCPVHKGKAGCFGRPARTLYRIDMEDKTGTRFCDACAEDAEASGLFGREDAS